MPSLQALKEFRTSFNHIGGEMASLKEQNIPFDDLPLPGQTESEEAAFSGPSGISAEAGPGAEIPDLDFNLDDFVDMDLGADSPAGSAAPAGDESVPAAPPGAGIPAGIPEPEEDGTAGGMDFGAFLDNIPDDLSPPETGDFTGNIPGEADDLATDIMGGSQADDSALDGGATVSPSRATDDAGRSAAEDEAVSAGDDFSIPEDLLSGLNEDLGSEASPPDLGGELSGLEDLGGEASPLDLGGETSGLEDLGGEASPLDLGGETSPLDLGGETSGLEDLGGEASPLDLGGETSGLEDLGGETSGLEDLGGEASPLDLGGELSGLEDLGGEDAGSTAETGAAAEDDFSVPEDLLSGFEEGANPESPGEADLGDSFDNFDMSAGGRGAAAGDSGKLEEFTLPGIDDIFTGTGGEAEGGADLDGGGEVEEIQLTEDQLDQLRKTLAGYPLNLRIACEELIAEQAVVPEEMSRLVKLLVNGAPARETAALAGKILGRAITIPRGFEKKTGEDLEAEQSSFGYIFVRKFLPIFGVFMMIALAALSLLYLTIQFVYYPLKAESIYRTGLERLEAGEFERANERFNQAFGIHRKKNWFYRYAEGFREKRQYIYAEQKYDELLAAYPRDRKGVLDYAAMESGELRNYQKAEDLLRRQILDYAPDDYDALLALGDNSLEWGETEYSKYEDARFSYARLLDKYGWKDPVVERMLRYFIRTDNLKEVLPLQSWFMDNKKRKISAGTLAELGGYLLDKQLEEKRTPVSPRIPNEYADQIDGIREILLRAAEQDPNLPESHYHLSRYYQNLGNTHEERITLERAINAFDGVRERPVGRIRYHIDALRRYAEILKNAREFSPAEEHLVRGINIYEDALSRRLFSPSPGFGRLYADLGDLVYFTKDGDWETALAYYARSERNGWAPPEIQYRMGAAHYLLEEWPLAMERFFVASGNLPLNRRILYALGNTAFKRGNYFAAQGYYSRLLDILEGERSRLPLLLPNEGPEYVELAERLMTARNNMGVTLEALTRETGDNRYRSRALALYTESARAWDALTRNPQTMIRLLPLPGLYGPGVNPAYLNVRNSLYPVRDYEYYFFLPVDRDVLEPSDWETLSPPGYRLSGSDDDLPASPQ
ncbi:MAG: tetratricopeptide repeat protein [Treponema sp.]|jgi:tetratricopeptide (TPR) repeat protein|nr:tetratricopeptide repeat protein [Treponema sp.]